MAETRKLELPVLGNSVMLMAGLAEGMQRTGGYNYLGLHSTVGASDYRTAGGVGGNEWALDGTPNAGHSRRAGRKRLRLSHHIPYRHGSTLVIRCARCLVNNDACYATATPVLGFLDSLCSQRPRTRTCPTGQTPAG